MTDNSEPVSSLALAAWLAPRLEADAVTITAFSEPKSGYSAQTVMFNADVTRGSATMSERFVLRLETPESPVYPIQNPSIEVEINVQYRAMELVAAADPSIPLAPLHGFENDISVLGAAFFVMGFVAGEVPVEDPIYTKSGFFVDAAPEQRKALVDDGVAVMARIHRIDWQAAGFDWLQPEGVVPGTSRQMDLWHSYTYRELDGRSHPLVDDTWNWLKANQPSEQPLGFSWGDPRPGNVIWRDFKAVTVTDFEACSIVPAEFDLGWWLMFDRWSHETYDVPRLEGEPSREQQRNLYQQLLGRDLGDVVWYEIFAAARYCGIVVRVMNRLVERNIMPSDHNVWFDNPAVDCLNDLVAEHGL